MIAREGAVWVWRSERMKDEEKEQGQQLGAAACGRSCS